MEKQDKNLNILRKSEICFKMEDWCEIVNLSIFGYRSAKISITLAGMFSEDQKMVVVKDI